MESAISGHERTLVRSGKSDPEQMRRALVTQNDLEEAVRKRTGSRDLGGVERAILERNGDITVRERK